MRSRGFAIRPQSVTDKANAPGTHPSPGGAQRVKKPSRQAILPQKRPNFRVIARPHRGRGNLKVIGMASRGEAREHEAKENPYHKNMGIAASFRFLSLSFKVLFRSVLPYFVSGWQIASLKIAASGAKLRPPRNDRIGRLDRKYGTQNPLFRFRKTLLICCLILTVPDFFDSLKRPRGSDESRGRCCLCGNLCAADFRKLTADASVGASAGLYGRCVRSDFRSVFQPIFQATMESPYLIIS